MSRIPLIESAALAAALASGSIAGAAIDELEENARAFIAREIRNRIA